MPAFLQSVLVFVRIPGIYPCVRSIPVKNNKLFYFLGFMKESLEEDVGFGIGDYDDSFD